MLLQRLVITLVSVAGLLIMTSAGIMLTLVRRSRRQKQDGSRDRRDTGRPALDDLVKLLCYTGRRRRRGTGTAAQGREDKPPSGTVNTHQQTTTAVLPDHSEIVQLVLRTQAGVGVGGPLMHENERYSSAADINARGTSLLRSALA